MNFECGLTSDNVDEVTKLIEEGGAALKVSVFPWGAEFDIVRSTNAGKRQGDDS